MPRFGLDDNVYYEQATQPGDWSTMQQQQSPPSQTDPTQQQQNPGNALDQLKQILGSDYSPDSLKQKLAQIKALGIKVQNEQRGDLRPRFLLPDGTTWDFGPGGWVSRGNIGDWSIEGGPGSSAPGSAGQATAGISTPESDLQNTPGYQFALQQGIDAIQKSAAAKGTLLTGGTLKGIAQYATGLADQTYGSQYERFLELAKLGIPPPPQPPS